MENKKELIGMFLDLLNTDLSKQSLESRLDILINLHRKIFGFQSSIAQSKKIMDDFTGAYQELDALQDRLRHFVSQLRLKSAKVELNGKERAVLGNLPAMEDFMILDSVKTHTQLQLKVKTEPYTIYPPTDEGLPTSNLPGTAFQDSLMEATILPPENSNGLFFFFLLALDGLPISSLQECQQCEKWFFKFGKRKHIFCSDVCRATWANKRKLDDIKKDSPDIYKTNLERGRKRAKDSYEKRKKEKRLKGVRVVRIFSETEDSNEEKKTEQEPVRERKVYLSPKTKPHTSGEDKNGYTH